MPEVVVLRGEYCINRDLKNTLCSPNATKGEVVLASGSQFSAMMHIDNEENLGDLQKFLGILKKLDHNLKCNVMGRDSGSLRGAVTNTIRDYAEEINQETWSGNHHYNIFLGPDGIVVDNSSNSSRRLITNALLGEGGEKRVNMALGEAKITKLSEIKSPHPIKPVSASKISGRSR